MYHIETIEGELNISGAKFALLVTRFNSFIVESLLKGAVDCLLRHGAKKEDLQIIKIPGAFEMPIAAQAIAQKAEFDAIIALGAVIRGGTPHFDFVANEATKGLANVAANSSIPVTFGLLTTDNIEQAIERSGTKAGNKGEEAAMSAIEIVNVLKQINAST